MTLQRWHELECGDGNEYASWSIERDPVTDKPYMVTHPHKGNARRVKVADRERGALKRIAGIMAGYPALVAVDQGDPRVGALYLVERARIPEGKQASDCSGLCCNY